MVPSFLAGMTLGYIASLGGLPPQAEAAPTRRCTGSTCSLVPKHGWGQEMSLLNATARPGTFLAYRIPFRHLEFAGTFWLLTLIASCKARACEVLRIVRVDQNSVCEQTYRVPIRSA